MDPDLLLEAGEFVDARSLLGEAKHQAPSSDAIGSAQPRQSPQPLVVQRSGRPGSLWRLAEMDAALADNLDSLLQSNFESVEQVLGEPSTLADSPAGATTVHASLTTVDASAADVIDVEDASSASSPGGAGCISASQGAVETAADRQFAHGQSVEGQTVEGRVVDGSLNAADAVAASSLETVLRRADSRDGDSATAACVHNRRASAGEAGTPILQASLQRADLPRHTDAAELADSSPVARAELSVAQPATRAEPPRSTDALTRPAWPRAAHRALGSHIASLRHPVLRALDLMSRPLALVPARFHYAIDVVSLSTLAWAAVVWAILLFSRGPAVVKAQPPDDTPSRAATESMSTPRLRLPLDDLE